MGAHPWTAVHLEQRACRAAGRHSPPTHWRPALPRPQGCVCTGPDPSAAHRRRVAGGPSRPKAAAPPTSCSSSSSPPLAAPPARPVAPAPQQNPWQREGWAAPLPLCKVCPLCMTPAHPGVLSLLRSSTSCPTHPRLYTPRLLPPTAAFPSPPSSACTALPACCQRFLPSSRLWPDAALYPLCNRSGGAPWHVRGECSQPPTWPQRAWGVFPTPEPVTSPGMRELRACFGGAVIPGGDEGG